MKSPSFFIILIFFLSRIICYSLGIKLHAPLEGPQTIDLNLLKNRAIESIFYLHSQPPLFNLFQCIGFKLFEKNFSFFFHCIYALMGLLQGVTMYLAMIKLGTLKILAFILAILFLVCPSTMLYESWFCYEYPTMVFLSLSVLYLYEFLSNRSISYGITFFTLLAMVVLTRSMFHIFWFIMILIMLSFVSKISLKKILLASFLPLVVILFWFGKNYFLFNSFSSSTSFGMNMARITTDRLNTSEKNILINQGILSPISQISPFSFLDDYRGFIVTDNRAFNKQRNIPILFNEKKSSRSKVSWFSSNFNHIDYIEISNQYKRNAYSLIINRPIFYLKQTFDAVKIYFKPSSHHFGVKWSYKKIKKYSDIYNAIFLGCLKKISTLSLWSVAFYIFITFYMIYLVFKKKTYNLDKKAPNYIIIYFLVFNIVYNFFISNLFEFGENNRFTFCISPLSVMLFGLILSRHFPNVNNELKKKVGQ